MPANLENSAVATGLEKVSFHLNPKERQCKECSSEVKSLSHVQLFATPWTVAYQASLSMGFSRQEYWNGLPFPSPRMLKLPHNCSNFTWQHTPVLLPGKSHGQRSLVVCSPWNCEEPDATKQLHFHALEKELATHSSVLAWRNPGTEEPGGLPSMGSHSRT